MQASDSIVIDSTQRLLKNGITLALLTSKLTAQSEITAHTQNNKKNNQKNNLALQANNAKLSSKASISISINRGHFHTTGYPDGFAHLLEHMLFSSSKDYEQADALDQHLFEYHGQVNGWTQDLSTHFTLQCAPQGFYKACQILIDKLANPLFLPEHIKAEISAIDAEFKSKKSSPIRQLLSVQKSTSNQAHPFSRFSTGNRNSLLGPAPSVQKSQIEQVHTPSENQIKVVQQQLRRFHQLTMQGQYIDISLGLPEGQIKNTEITSIETLIDNAFTKKYANVTSVKETVDDNIPVYKAENLEKYIQIKAEQKEHQLLFSYQLVNVEDNARDSMFIMLTHSIESKHKNGLYDYLLKQHYIQDLQAYYKAIDARTDELVISLLLRDEGVQNIQKIQACVQGFLNYLRQSGIENWRYREKQQQYLLQSSLQRPAGLYESCINVSQQLHNKTAQECLQTPDFDIKLAIKAMPSALASLEQKSLRLYFISPLAQTDQVTAHYNAKYKITPLPSLEQTPNYTFSKARQNPFMSAQHPLVQSEVAPTHLQHYRDDGCELKFYQDIRFRKPNGECYMSITEPNMCKNAHQIAIKRVWLACLQQHLVRQFFDVELASIHYRVYAHQHGISIHTGGLSERQLLLCIELVNAIKNFKADALSVQDQLANCISSLESMVEQKPFNRLFGFLNEFYQDPNKTNVAVLSELKKLQVEDVLACQQSYFKDNFVETLLVGNWTLNSAERFFKQISTRFHSINYRAKPPSYAKSIGHAQHQHFSYPQLDECNVIRHYIPVLNTQEKDLASPNSALALQLSARSLVLEKLLSGHVFETLRQKYKMGYMLGIGYKPIGGFPGIAMYISSPTHSELEIYEAMTEAIKTALSQFDSKKGMLQHLVEDLLNQVAPKEPDISQVSARIWMHYDDSNPALAYQDLSQALLNLREAEIRDSLKGFAEHQFGQMTLTQSKRANVSLQ